MKKIVVILSISVLILLVPLFSLSQLSPSETVDEFLHGLQTGDTEAAKAVYAGEDMDWMEKLPQSSEAVPQLEQTFYRQVKDTFLEFQYELSNEQIDGERAAVDVKITTYDLGNVFTQFATEYFQQKFSLSMGGASEQELDRMATEILTEKLQDVTFDYSQTVSLPLVQVDGKWAVDEIQSDSAFFNAFTGGMVSAGEDLEESLDLD